MLELKGPDYTPEFKVLEDADLNTLAVEESDAKSRKKLACLGSTKRTCNEPSDKKRKKTMSWLWAVGGGPGGDEAGLHECK
jgi:hypothetical protein